MKRIIYTSYEPNWEYWKITGPTLEAYAEKVGAELINLPKVSPNPQWVLFHAFQESLKVEAEVAWMDADLLTRSDAPDIFRLPERFYTCPPVPASRIHPKWRKGHGRFNVPNPRPYPITAIVRWADRHAEPLAAWYFENFKNYPKKWGDQELLAHALFELEVAMFYFPHNWHRMTGQVTQGNCKKISFFHPAGPKKMKKLETLQKWLNR